MLIYNHKFEFIGIDEKDLKKLGFKTLAGLKTECNDFADLFVKKPSYIHNFKNFKWILYILNSNSDESRAIISIQNRIYTTTLEINTIYLLENPTQEAYIVSLNNLRQIEGEPIDIQTPSSLVEQEPNVTQSTTSDIIAPTTTKPIDDKIDEDIYTDNNLLKNDEPSPTQPIIQIDEPPMLGDYINPDTQDISSDKNINNYTYDPTIASQELGLPVDLIEEFIGDFIQQAYEFKDELYLSFQNHDFETVKNLSHKLKGVSANLRIEDAFKALSIINTSHDEQEIKDNLNIFYKVIQKLDKKAETNNVKTANPIIEQDDGMYVNLLKDNDDITQSLPQTEKNNSIRQQIEPNEKPGTFLQKPQVTEEIHKVIEPKKELIDNVPKIKKSLVTDLKYDKQKAINELGLNEIIINELLNDFKEQSIITVSHMSDALEINNLKQIQHLALSAKGVCDNLRLVQISSLLDKLISNNENQDIKENVKLFLHYITQL